MTSKKYALFNGQKNNAGSYNVNYLSLYRYATRWDLFVIFQGVIFTFFKALSLPWIIIVYSEFTSLLVERIYGIGTSSPTLMLKWFGGGKILTNATMEENRQEIINDSLAYGYLSIIATAWQFIFGILCVDCFNRTAIRQVTHIRIKYFESLLRQDIGWYDVAGGKTNFTVRITEDIEKIKNGLAEDVSHFLYLMFSFVICIIIAFIYGWELTLIVISYLPIVFVTNIIIGKLQAKSAERELNAYAKAANVVEEVLCGVRTVFAFGGEKVEVGRYNKLLQPAKVAAKRVGLYSSITDGITRFLFFASCALSFWFGVQWVLHDRDKIDKQYTPATLLIIFFGLVSAADNIAETTPFLLTFSLSRASAKCIFAVIDRNSKIDPISIAGDKLNSNKIIGNIEFKNVNFSYPSRPDVQILDDFNLKIKPGETVALVGNSGNGKSTCLQLLQRFYDPNRGELLLDDRNLKTLNIHSLRSCIAIVGQEPVLFSTTIAENIRYGKPDATHDEIIEAAKNSGAHSFISYLTKGYDTLVGSNGSQLSGGQKQRIAIARALIQNPKILLLDEATSALDYQTEKHIQETLDRASKGRTTIVISHRLSAIKGADRLLFLEKGKIIEEGTHDELLKLRGKYYNMVKSVDFNDEFQKSYRKRKISGHHKVKQYTEITVEESDDDQSDDYFMEENEEEEKKENVMYFQNFLRILQLAKADWKGLLIAIVSALIVGSAYPLFAIAFAEIYGALSYPNLEEALDEVFLWCMSFLGIGVFILIGAMNQTYFFTRTGANLTQRVRSKTFEAMLRQECGWFDDHKNSVGALESRLTSDAANLQTAIGYPFSLILQAISTFATGIIVAFTSSVKLSLICLASVPILLTAIFLEARHLAKSTLSEKEAIAAGTKIASESIQNIRTVASLRQEKQMIKRFVKQMEVAECISREKIRFRGTVNSFSQAIPWLAYAVALWYGGNLVAHGEIHYKNIVRISEAMLYGTLFMCQTLVFAPTITTAFIGAHGVFKIIDRKPLITSIMKSSASSESDQSKNIDFKDISFIYPTRPNIQVLDDFNLKISEGKTIALVGHSGSGKSTCIQLLQRLYDPQYGQIFIGQNNIETDITIKDLRSKLSIVSQEPVLFNRSIAENIAYGDNTRNVSMEEIIEAAKVANAHSFVVQLPEGYETNVGSKATQLSGGQKQRIAIARALIRNPKILLLDEATSALDLNSEQIVQQALDSARSGRTCIIIAHRLSTIQNVDIISVVSDGMIIESGTHPELLAINGAYSRLYNAQN